MQTRQAVFFSFGATAQIWALAYLHKIFVSLLFTGSWTFGRTPWAGDQLVARPLPVSEHRKTHKNT
jgi:hypothetical protein